MDLLTLNLKAEALAEAERLSAARTWTRDGDDGGLAHGNDGAPLVARARRSRTRQSLAGRALVIFRLAWDDGNARTVEWYLAAALVPPGDPGATPARNRLREAAMRVERAARPVIEAEAERLGRAAVAIGDRFAAARLQRARAIVDRSAPVAAPRQVGLFDRRDERARCSDAAAAAERIQRALGRIRAAESGAIASHRIELVLVLLP
jgi:hypothetical protein